MDVAWASFWEKAGAGNLVIFHDFSGKVALAGDERYLVCAAGAGWVRPRPGVVRSVMAASMCFVLFLHIAVTWCFGIFACKTHCNGCMIVVILCCHVRREMRVWNLMLQDAL